MNDLNKELTLIIVSHRLNALKKCDKVYEVKEKKLRDIKNLNYKNNF